MTVIRRKCARAVPRHRFHKVLSAQAVDPAHTAISHAAELMSFPRIAVTLQVPESTIRITYAMRLMPAPEGRFGNCPLWTRHTVLEWARQVDLSVFEEQE